MLKFMKQDKYDGFFEYIADLAHSSTLFTEVNISINDDKRTASVQLITRREDVGAVFEGRDSVLPYDLACEMTRHRPPVMTLENERTADVEQLRSMLQINGVSGVLKMLQEAVALEPGVEVT